MFAHSILICTVLVVLGHDLAYIKLEYPYGYGAVHSVVTFFLLVVMATDGLFRVVSVINKDLVCSSHMVSGPHFQHVPSHVSLPKVIRTNSILFWFQHIASFCPFTKHDRCPRRRMMPRIVCLG